MHLAEFHAGGTTERNSILLGAISPWRENVKVAQVVKVNVGREDGYEFLQATKLQIECASDTVHSPRF